MWFNTFGREARWRQVTTMCIHRHNNIPNMMQFLRKVSYKSESPKSFTLGHANNEKISQSDGDDWGISRTSPCQHACSASFFFLFFKSQARLEISFFHSWSRLTVIWLQILGSIQTKFKKAREERNWVIQQQLWVTSFKSISRCEIPACDHKRENERLYSPFFRLNREIVKFLRMCYVNT